MSLGGSAVRVLDRVRRRRETPVVLCFDVEPDLRVFDPGSPPPWLGFERFAERIPELRRRLSEATGRPAAFTWALRMDPQIEHTWGSPGWAAERYEDLFGELMECGDEFGLHTHIWRWDPEADDWFADFEDPGWSEHCLNMSLDSFEAAFGRTCKVHRGGDHFLHRAMLPILEKRGVKIDLTVEPGQPPVGSDWEGEIARGSSPDYRGVPPRPYRSSPGRFPAPDAGAHSDPLLVPHLSAPRKRPPFQRLPLFLWEDNSFEQRLALELLLKSPPIVALAMRTDSAVFDERWGLWDLMTERLEHLARYPGMVFVTASEATDRYEAHSDDRTRPEAIAR